MTANTAQPNSKEIVLLVHGIRTHAHWISELEAVFRKEGIEARGVGYGRFDTVRFLLPECFGLRKEPIERVKRAIALARSDGYQVSVLAHSFGTYIVGKIMLDDTTVKLHRLILCGSVLPNGFRWDKTRQSVTREDVINDFSTGDIWPFLAEKAGWGYGNSGTYGFQSGLITERKNFFRHSDYFANLQTNDAGPNPECYAAKMWIPFFKGGKTEYLQQKARTPWWEPFLDWAPALLVKCVTTVVILLLTIALIGTPILAVCCVWLPLQHDNSATIANLVEPPNPKEHKPTPEQLEIPRKLVDDIHAIKLKVLNFTSEKIDLVLFPVDQDGNSPQPSEDADNRKLILQSTNITLSVVKEAEFDMFKEGSGWYVIYARSDNGPFHFVLTDNLYVTYRPLLIIDKSDDPQRLPIRAQLTQWKQKPPGSL